MSNKLTPSLLPPALVRAGHAANDAASRRAFQDYQQRKASNTRRRQRADLALFAEFLDEAGIETGKLYEEPAAWAGVTWGLVEAFCKWQLLQGYSIGSVNVRLATTKMYARLAVRAGSVAIQEYSMIQTVTGYSRTEGRRVDEARTAAETPTRVGHKKAEPVLLTPEQGQALKAATNYDDNPQGRRDRFIACVLIDHGLRCGELAGLKVGDFALEDGRGYLRFYRPKVDKIQQHRLEPDTLSSLRVYLPHDAPSAGALLRGSRKGGELSKPGMKEQSITARVALLGRVILGVGGLSAHDLRHHWATQAAAGGTSLKDLQYAGGWSSVAMPLRYIADAEIANEGVVFKRP
jgi:integrase